VAGTLGYAASARLVDKDLLSKSLVPEINRTIEEGFWIAASQALNQDTGLAFDRNDAGRIGDFELLDFPSGDVYGRSSVVWKPITTQQKSIVGTVVKTGCRAVEVRVTKSNSNAFAAASSVCIGCEIRSDNEVISDEIREVSFDGDRIVQQFDAPEQVCKVGISVWVVDEDQSSLVYREHGVLVRQVVSNFGIVGAEGRLQGGWSNHVNPKGAEGRLADAESFKRVQYERRELGGYENDLWVSASRKQREKMLRLRPDISGARFFPIGWEPEFATWLKELTSVVDIERVLLIDPYFDPVGLISLIARAGVQNAKYSVLTAFNHRPKGGEVSRHQLTERCEQLRTVLPTYFRIEEIAPVGASDDALIHDRYLMLWNRAGEVVRAFSLTNSLQGATREHPMLATPIPTDVLPEVVSYIRKIQSGEHPRGTAVTVKTLWEKYPAERKRNAVAGPDYRGIAEVLLRKRFDNNFSAQTALDDAGICDSATNQFNLEAVKGRLIGPEPTESPRVRMSIEGWSALSEVSVRTEEEAGMSLLHDVIVATGNPGLDLVEEVITGAPVRQMPSGTANAEVAAEDLTMASAVLHPFQRALKNANSLLDRPWEFRGVSVWPLTQAVRFLAAKYPDRLIRALGQLVDCYSPTLRDGGATPATYPVARAISIALSHVGVSFYRPEREALETAFIASRVGLLRAIGTASVCGRFIDGTIVQESSLNRLRLPADELVFAVAHIHNSLLSQRSRVRESSLSPYDAATIDSKLLISRRLLSESFPPNLTKEKLRGVANAISGPLEGHDAIELQRILDDAAKIGTLEIGLSHSLFFELFISKVSEFIDTKTRSIFYLPVDGPLTLVMAQVSGSANEESRGIFFCNVARIGDQFLNQLRAPFLRSKDYTSWKNARDGALWIVVFIDALESVAQADGVDEVPGDLTTLRSELESALRPFPEEERFGSHIDWFADFVRQAQGKIRVMELAEQLHRTLKSAQ
jgi:hypothetical protein